MALRHWRAEHGAQATYTNLAEVFKRCSNLDLAKRVTELATREQTDVHSGTSYVLGR